MPGVNSARTTARRVILSALAGGGMTAVGLGGPLSGGALAADPSTGLGTSSETSTTPAPEAPTQSTTSTTTTTTPPATGTTTVSTPVEPPPTTTTQSATTTQPTTQPPTQTTSTSPTRPPHLPTSNPRVVVQHTQQPTEGETTDTTTTSAATTPTPARTPATGAGNIAVAPQLAAAQQSALAAMIAGSAASTRALDFYRIPLFLLPIYQAAAVQYGVPWPILAAINEVETNFGTDLSVSTAGAVGWMQFMPETWLQYGVDAVNAGYADPYNPVDAIFAAARYLHAAGASSRLAHGDPRLQPLRRVRRIGAAAGTPVRELPTVGDRNLDRPDRGQPACRGRTAQSDREDPAGRFGSVSRRSLQARLGALQHAGAVDSPAPCCNHPKGTRRRRLPWLDTGTVPGCERCPRRTAL